ncbi:MAG: type II toxin-antitoxin system VapC family toxin [Niastella sp.]|nr:type II toxin-antitoxin system VapC family toxin [Niastella sp.]
MTGNKVLLDTNIVIELFKGDQRVLTFLDEQQNVFIAAAVLAELYLGAYRSGNEQKHIEQIRTFLLKCTVLSADQTTAESCAKVKTALLKKGKPIPENDIWIAATALQYNLPLYTNDKHFSEVDNIVLI